jgi:hypothetical protein
VIELDRRRKVVYSRLVPSDLPKDRDDPELVSLAKQIMLVEAYAYASRLPASMQDIFEAFDADPGNEEHLAATIHNLYSNLDNWRWVLAHAEDPIGDSWLRKDLQQLSELGTGKLVGFALTAAEPAANNIHMLELHALPPSLIDPNHLLEKRLRIGTHLAFLALNEASKTIPRRRNMTASLRVAMMDPDDQDEHPFAWYKDLGFEPVGRPKIAKIVGRLRLPLQLMSGSLSTIHQGLKKRLPRDK